MNRNNFITFIFLVLTILVLISFKRAGEQDYYLNYNSQLQNFQSRQVQLIKNIEKSDLNKATDRDKIKFQINFTRNTLKGVDFWLRYLDPTIYKKINGPLPVEWETEVFEKSEKPYRREGAGLTLAFLYLDEENIEKDSLIKLISASINSTKIYCADSITQNLKTHHHFFLCNRLFLLNLAAIYTTGFECPDTSRIIPELSQMLSNVSNIYSSFNASFSQTPLTDNYFVVYNKMLEFVKSQTTNYQQFDHFTFVKEYVNPLFTINQQLIREYKIISESNVDYALNKNSSSIFSKNLYNGQNSKGIFLRVNDPRVLNEIEKIGKLLFYDPVLSGNNLRSCASCHKAEHYFSDTASPTSLQFDGKNFLPRNSPSLLNAQYNHLIMLDGKHISLQHQTKDVITNPLELGGDEKEVLKKILSCNDYKKAFKEFLKYTPAEKEITLEHVCSSITMYYSKFSKYYSPFDMAMNNKQDLANDAKKGFNLFMGKAQCATCHFAPQFNGVKPPYVSSEFEVIGVPKDTAFKELSHDKGRFAVNQAFETANAFRTGTIRNADKTAPYMHNGVFKTLSEVIDFYNFGGGAGKGLKVNNQTLSSDSLHLTAEDKIYLVAFIKSLSENIQFESVPETLPQSKIKGLNKRQVGGKY